ncbi:MAG: hypothetical protein ABII01_03680 [Candidatus Woesearchaeota archaeon]
MVNKKLNPKGITGSRLGPNEVKVQELNNSQLIITFPKGLAQLTGISKGTILSFKINDSGKIEIINNDQEIRKHGKK